MITFYKWMEESTLRTLAGLAVILLFMFIGYQATYAVSWNVSNEPQMRLENTITPTATDVVLAAPQRNGASTTFYTTTGGILRLRNGASFWEDIHYTSATVNADKTVTLNGVTRDVCAQHGEVILGCGNGRQWPAGTIVELTVDSRLLNLKVNKDRLNLLSGSGQISGTGTGQAIIDLPCITTAQRDAFTYITDNGEIICNSDTGTFQQRIAGAWVNFGSGSTVNATESVAGKSQLADTGAMVLGSATGSTAAPLVLQSKYTILGHSTYTPAFMTCGFAPTTNVATWAGTSDGSFTFTIDGSVTDVTAIDFSGDADLDDVASTIQSAIQSTTGQSETVTYEGNGSQTGFVITSSNLTVNSAISVLSAQGAGTDISGAGATAYMDCDSGHGTGTVLVVDPTRDYGKIPIISTLGSISGSLLSSNYATAYSDFGDTGSYLRIDGTFAELPSGTICISATGSSIIDGSVGDKQTFDVTCTVPARHISTGSTLDILASGKYTQASTNNDLRIGVHFDNTEISRGIIAPGNTNTDATWSIASTIHVREHSATGEITNSGFFSASGATVTSFSDITPVIKTDASTGAILKIFMEFPVSESGDKGTLDFLRVKYEAL